MSEYTSKQLYPEIYAMRPAYECEPGWWKLRWKPIWGRTWRVYLWRPWKWDRRPRFWLKCFQSGGFGFRWWRDDAHNGWGRSYECLCMEIRIFVLELGFWIKWNYRVMSSGPGSGTPVPLELPIEYHDARASACEWGK